MRWHLLLVLAVVVTAGCNSLFAAGDDASDAATETLTPAPVPEVTLTPERWEIAPGVSSDGVDNVTALVAAHRAATANQSYVWRERRGATTDLNRTVPVADQTVARVESGSTYYFWTVDERIRLQSGLRTVANYSEYVDGAVQENRYQFAGGPTYRRQQFDPAPPSEHRHIGLSATSAIRQYFDVENTTVSAVRIDGRRHYRIVAGDWPGFAAESVSNGTVTAVVSPDGFVRSLEAAYTIYSADQSRRVRYAFTYERVGNTTVDPPDWFRKDR